jgi:long-chain acyl-CoA synthetase
MAAGTPHNLVALHHQQAQRFGSRPAVRFKRYGLYRDLIWDDYRSDVLACAAALVERGIRPGDRVGLLSENRVEWLIADLAIMAAGAINVPPHAPLTGRQIHYQLADAGARWLFVSTAAQFGKILPVLAELPAIEGIIVFDRFQIPAELAKPTVHGWDRFLQHGRNLLTATLPQLAQREAVLGSDDLATIMYTSGTTGNPKGVMLTHGNLLSNVFATLEAEPCSPDNVQLNWLPFSHIYARTIDHYATIASGGLLALAECADTLVDNLKEVQPMHMHSVPRFYEKVLAAKASPDPEVTGRRLRSVFGPRIHWLGSGGAPLPLAVAEAYHAAGLCLLQGYGLTESAPVISFNRSKNHRLGTVGQPLPGVEVKLGPDGEVLTRGPHVMKGYWNNPQATSEAIHNGWLHTGDIGTIDADGFLSITGRKKELLVLSNGKKVVPNYLEGLLLADPCIDQAVVFGEGRKFLTALIVPNWDNLRQALAAANVALDGTAEECLCQHEAVCALLRKRIDAALVDVSSAEQVKKFVVLPRPFSVAADELTVSLKLRRNVIVAHHQAELDNLYWE